MELRKYVLSAALVGSALLPFAYKGSEEKSLARENNYVSTTELSDVVDGILLADSCKGIGISGRDFDICVGKGERDRPD